jgi:hypothetical protein
VESGRRHSPSAISAWRPAAWAAPAALRQRDDGAYGAGVGRVPVRIVIGGGMLLKNGLRRGGGLVRYSMKMAERKRKLNSQRQQRQARAVSDVRSKPLHAENASRRKSYSGRCNVTADHRKQNTPLARCENARLV